MLKFWLRKHIKNALGVKLKLDYFKKVIIEGVECDSYKAIRKVEGKEKELIIVPFKNENRIIIFFDDYANEITFDSKSGKKRESTIAFRNDDYGWLYEGDFGLFLPEEQINSII